VENGKRRGVKKTRSDEDEVWAKRITSVKLIYNRIQDFE
jgi:ribosomal protein L19E